MNVNEIPIIDVDCSDDDGGGVADEDDEELPFRVPVGLGASNEEIMEAAKTNLLQMLLEEKTAKDRVIAMASRRRREEINTPFFGGMSGC